MVPACSGSACNSSGVMGMVLGKDSVNVSAQSNTRELSAAQAQGGTPPVRGHDDHCQRGRACIAHAGGGVSESLRVAAPVFGDPTRHRLWRQENSSLAEPKQQPGQQERARPPAMPVEIVALAQTSPQAMSVRRAPSRSLTQPPMIWKTR